MRNAQSLKYNDHIHEVLPLPSLETPTKTSRLSIDAIANKTLRWYFVTDAFALLMGCLLSFTLAIMINSVLLGESVDPMIATMTAGIGQFLLIALGVLVWFAGTNHYNMRMPFWVEARLIVTAIAIAMLSHGFLQFAVKADFSRLWLFSGWIIAGLGMIGLRALTRGVLMRRGVFQVPTLLIGGGELAQHTRDVLAAEPSLGYEVITQIRDLPEFFFRSGQSWKKLCRDFGTRYVIVALDPSELKTSERPLAQLMRENIPFSIVPSLPQLPVMGMVPQYTFNSDILLLTRRSGLQQPMAQLSKRMLDVVVSSLALAALSPIMAIVAWIVRSDGGPALYGHKRIGQDGKTFYCLKFRSMVSNGDEVLRKHLANNPEAQKEWEATRKLLNDPRVTRIGDFLRRSSLDELPQLINVLKGEMSLVGPRPIVAAEVTKYEGDIAHYYRVKPGITGLWQVSGRSDVSYPQRVQMDSWYVRNWSFWHDIAILCKTIPALLNRSGAY
jgi:Undecaprenyl-phosphate galactose phosphotransferase WbaP